jgi:hypothetical protein
MQKNRSFAFLLLVVCFSQGFAQIDHWETAVNFNTTWKYFPGTSEPNVAWPTAAFNDAAWSAGTGGIGFGDGDDNTVIAAVPSLYLRKSFTIADTSVILQALLSIDYDDGFIAYLNGVEIARANLGTVTGDRPPYTQFANGQHEALMYQGGDAEQYIVTRAKLRTAMVVGNNVLAVTVHNATANSPDMSSLTWLHFGIANATTYFGPNPTWFVPPISSSNLPLVLIETHGASINDSLRVVCNMGIISNPGAARNYLSDAYNDYDGRIAIEIRGSTSQQYPKKSYGFETQDSLGANNNVRILGMPSENDWILYAPYPDKTLMRNTLAYHLFGRMQHYTPNTRFCELLIDGQYVGVYEIHERVKIDKNRLDLPKLDSDDIAGDSLTGGYVVKVDKTTGTGGPNWTSPLNPNVFFQFHDPEETELVQAQKTYIQTFVSSFETAHNGANFADPINGYRKYIDVQSFMDFMIMQELGRTVDGYRSSCFLHKQQDSYGGRLSAGPMWDFNLSFGNADYCDAYLQSGYQYNFGNVCPGYVPEVPFWWAKFMQDNRWRTELRCRWDFLREGPLHTDTLNAWIDSVALHLAESKDRNFVRWPILGVDVNWNYFVGLTYAEEIDYLKMWIGQRIAWLDANLPAPPTVCSSQGADNIYLTEINYNAAATADAGDWFELHNGGNGGMSLFQWRFKNGNTDNLFTFPSGTYIPPGGYLVVCEDTLAFHTQHPTVSNIVGPFNFGLGNGGDRLRIFDTYYTEQISMVYGDVAPWVVGPDGGGYTLELLSLVSAITDPNSWIEGCLGGSPGGPLVLPCAVGIQDPSPFAGFIAFPNPFDRGLTIQFSEELQSPAHVDLLDLTGRVVFKADIAATNRHEFSTEGLAAGVYLLRASTANWTKSLRVTLAR